MPSASLKITVQCLLSFSPLLPELSCERAPILCQNLEIACSRTYSEYSPGKQLCMYVLPVFLVGIEQAGRLCALPVYARTGRVLPEYASIARGPALGVR
jgi:hypothetical protein